MEIRLYYIIIQIMGTSRFRWPELQYAYVIFIFNIII